MDWMPQAIRDGIIVVLIISGPLVLAAAAIGLVVGILQAATQVQEQTLGSALKIIGIFALIIIAGFWMFQYLNQYTSRTLTTAFTIVPHRTQKVLPRDAKGDEKFQDQFDNRELKVEPPEKPGGEFPEASSPAVPYVGKPSIPDAPVPKSKALPLSESPRINVQSLMPNIPTNFQEPIEIPEMTLDTRQFMEQEFPPVNLVPGNPSKKQFTDPDDLWQREETFSENTRNETEDNKPVEENLPSWID